MTNAASFDTYEPRIGARPAQGIFVAVGLVIAFVLIVAVGALNVYVDPRAEFASQNLPPVIDQAAMAKSRFFLESDADPGVLALGASRATNLWATDVYHETGWSAFNYAVGGASYRDVYDLFHFVTREAGLPNEVLLVIEPDMADRVDGDDRIRTDAALAELLQIEHKAGLREGMHPIRAGLTTLEMDYVQDTMRSLWFATVAGYPELISEGSLQGKPVHRVWFDGSVESPAARDYDHPNGDEARRRAIGIIPDVEDSFDSLRLSGPDYERNLGYLDEIIETMHAANGTVRIFFSPWQPDAWEALKDRPSFSVAHDTVAGRLATRCDKSLHIYRLSDPASLALDPAAFIDARHFHGDIWTNILSQVYDGSLTHLDACSPS